MLFRRLNWNVVGWFRTVSMISYVIIALGIAAMFWHATHAPGGGFQPSHALRLGLSFTGGTDVGVTFKKPVGQDQLRNALASVGVTDERITTVGAVNNGAAMRYAIESQVALGNDAAKLWIALEALAPVDRGQSQIQSVGPTLGREYLINALWALLIALGIQFIYIAFRFGWNYIFGLVTVIALVRDALMMVGIYAIADRPADDAFLAAVLTVIGYSVMDTIVILDRIRENTKLMAGIAYDRIVNTSILQTMTRSFNTLATVVITLVALLAFGGASLKNFAFALLVGICSGGYHSIFYSAPLVVGLRKRQLDGAARRRKAGLESDRTRTARSSAETGAIAARSGLAREDIVAARKERRAKSKVAPRPTGVPTKYKKQRPQVTTDSIGDPIYADENEEMMDPLDAQRSGVHDAAYDEGHEEVNLNFEGFEPEGDLQAPPGTPAEHDSANNPHKG